MLASLADGTVAAGAHGGGRLRHLEPVLRSSRQDDMDDVVTR